MLRQVTLCALVLLTKEHCSGLDGAAPPMVQIGDGPLSDL
jgi:hypothetical protein